MPSIRLLDLTNLVALSPSKHFFNGLLARLRPVTCSGRPGKKTTRKKRTLGLFLPGVLFVPAYIVRLKEKEMRS